MAARLYASVMLLDSKTFINFSFAGIVCPRINSNKTVIDNLDEEDAEAASSCEPFALQAKHFTELRLLNRVVDIVMDKVEKSGVVFGTVLHTKGNIAIEIARHGLGKVSERTIALVSKYVFS